MIWIGTGSLQSSPQSLHSQTISNNDGLPSATCLDAQNVLRVKKRLQQARPQKTDAQNGMSLSYDRERHGNRMSYHHSVYQGGLDEIQRAEEFEG